MGENAATPFSRTSLAARNGKSGSTHEAAD
jgi:hypothetical protein